jgi:hypothetical protein
MTINVNATFDKEIELMKQNDLHSNPELEIIKIQETFASVTRKEGPDSFTPMMIICNSDDDPVFVCEPRPYVSKSDMYVALAEMLFSYSAFSAKSFIMVNDTRMTMFDKDDNNVSHKIDALNIAFVNSDYACLAVLPYEISLDENQVHVVNWKNESFSISSITDSSAGAMTELYYIMSHLKNPVFNMNTLVNYYNFRDFSSVLPEESIAQKVEVYAKF